MTVQELAPGESTEPIVVRTPAELIDRGAFMATSKLRPRGGGEVEQIVSFGDSEENARTEVFQATRAALGHVQTMAPDARAVRIFITAASHMHDLREALTALESAESVGDDSIARQLRVYAIIAYGRTYGSRARADLTTIVEFSSEDAELTARLKVVRNKYGAHSENGMTTTTPILDLQRELDGSISIQQVTGITVDAPIPNFIFEQLAQMLRRLIDQLTAALQPLKDDVREELTPEQIARVFADPQPLQFVVAPISEWEPSEPRPAYPASRFSPIHLNADKRGTVNASITR
jgi:hypothetical protein